MTRFQRTALTIVAFPLLLLLGTGGVLFALSRALEHYLANDPKFGAVQSRFFNPSVSPLFSIRSDSVVLVVGTSRLKLVRPVVVVADWGGFRPSSAALDIHVDSMSVEPGFGQDAPTDSLIFPPTLRFPIGVVATVDFTTIRVLGRHDVQVEQLRFGNRGLEKAYGSFQLRPPRHGRGDGDSLASTAEDSTSNPRLMVEAAFEARWRGPTLRYDVQAVRPGRDSLTLSGIRTKQNLRTGYDTLHLFSADPAGLWETWGAPWTNPRSPVENGRALRALPAFSDVTVNGKADWRNDSLKLIGRFHSAAATPLHPGFWTIVAQVGGNGGRFQVNMQGADQQVRASGRWSHPGHWLSTPEWDRWVATLSGEVRGGLWKLGPFHLPLNFDIPEARLDTGLRVTARISTPDASRIDLHWDGRSPHRLELEGDVGSEEPWAVAWTRNNIAYTAAHFTGVWENSSLKATARIRKPHAYGAVADSLVAENEVTSSGYFLRRGKVYRDGEMFAGSGQVLWRNAAGAHEVSLAFDTEHPVHGRATVAMQVPGPLELTADSLFPSRFPYEPLRKLAAYDPWLQGRFFWNHQTGEGAVAVKTRFEGIRGELKGGLDAVWAKDSIRVGSVELASGESRLSGTGVLPFNGRTLGGLGGANVAWDLHNVLGGHWQVRTNRVNTEDVLAFTGRTAWPVRGILNGDLGFSSWSGMTGRLHVDSLVLPRSMGLTGVNALEIMAQGDSVRVDAVVTPRTQIRWNDTLFAVFSGIRAEKPHFRVEARSTGDFNARIEGDAPGWSRFDASASVSGSLPLTEGAGSLENIAYIGKASGTLGRNFLKNLNLVTNHFSLRHVSRLDTQFVSGTPVLSEGVLRVPDARVRNPRGGLLTGKAKFDLVESVARADVTGSEFDLILPRGEVAQAQDVASSLRWTRKDGLVVETEARNGTIALPPTPYRVETGFENLLATVSLPPDPGPTQTPTRNPSLTVDGRLHDFVFERKLGWRDATAFFTGIDRTSTRNTGTSRRSRAWDLDISLEAVGSRNRVDTDVLRMTFTGDARMTGVYPYMLVNGKISGLQGEVGQTRQAYVLRDFEVKWNNAEIGEGTLNVEGEKRLRSDCRPDTRQTCQIYIRLGGRLEDVGFTYDTDCNQTSGDPVSPSVLINSMAQGCYVSETPGGEGNYGSAAFAMLEPALNDRLSRGVARSSGGFIKSTQVSGLSALIGNDSTGLESVALEVESRSVYRASVKGRAGYHPETKLANPMEYRLAAEYRPPLERIVEDSVWRTRLKNRFTVEAAVETRPEGRDIEEERRVRQRAGLRYRHRFWTLWWW